MTIPILDGEYLRARDAERARADELETLRGRVRDLEAELVGTRAELERVTGERDRLAGRLSAMEGLDRSHRADVCTRTGPVN